MSAIQMSNLEMVNVLIEGGADVTAQNEVNYTTLYSIYKVACVSL